MLLQKHDCLFHWLDLIKGSVFDHLDISEVSHDSHEKLLFFLALRTLRENENTFSNLFVESLNVGDLTNGVVEQEASISIDPLANSVLQLLDKRSSIDSEPSDINLSLHLSNIVLNAGQESNFLIEVLKLWLFSLNATKDLLGHPFKGLILFLFTIIIDFDMFLLTWINSSVKESLEILIQSLFKRNSLSLY